MITSGRPICTGSPEAIIVARKKKICLARLRGRMHRKTKLRSSHRYQKGSKFLRATHSQSQLQILWSEKQVGGTRREVLRICVSAAQFLMHPVQINTVRDVWHRLV